MSEQNFASEIQEVSQLVEEFGPLNILQQTWVDFNAVGGVLIEADGNVKMSKSRRDRKGNLKRYSLEDLCVDLGVDDSTLYRWSQSIPKFQERVARRRQEIFSQSRVSLMYTAMFQTGMAGNVRAQQTFLANFDRDNFVMPTTNPKKADDDEQPKSWAELADKHRSRKVIDAKVVKEGEVVNATPGQTGPPQNI